MSKGNLHFDKLLNDISFLIENSEQQLVTRANSILTLLFWKIGHIIHKEVLHEQRADYGKNIIPNLSIQLITKYGRNFEEKNLRRMLQFAEQFTDEKIVVTLSRQLSWSHIITILPIKNRDAQLYYSRIIAESSLSVRDLRKKNKELCL